MREMIKDRQSTDTQDKHDLFSSLIQANKGEADTSALTDEELMGLWLLTLESFVLRTFIGNVFIFLLAGHEVGHLGFLKSLSGHVVPDDCTHPLIHFCLVGSLSGYPREIV